MILRDAVVASPAPTWLERNELLLATKYAPHCFQVLHTVLRVWLQVTPFRPFVPAVDRDDLRLRGNVNESCLNQFQSRRCRRASTR